MSEIKSRDKTRYILSTSVRTVREENVKTHTGGVGPEAKFVEVKLGWYVWLEGSYEAIHLGAEKPDLAPGDRVKITISKIIP